MRLEVIFKGPPSQFVVVMNHLRHRLFIEDEPLNFDFLYTNELPNQAKQLVHMTEKAPRGKRSKELDTYIIGMFITAQIIPGDKSVLYVDSPDKIWPRASKVWQVIEAKLHEQGWLELSGQNKKTGRPGLKDEELIYRLAKAQEAEELKANDRARTWKEIAAEIEWRDGASEPGRKRLEDARQRLHRLETNDPENLLPKVSEWRKRNKS